MNHADSRRLAAQLENLGMASVEKPEQADLIILNTCVVRQHAEDKIYGRLGALNKIKRKKPELLIAVMGCLVGAQKNRQLMKRVPYVDVLLSPSETGPLLAMLNERFGLTPPHAEEPDSELAAYRLPQEQKDSTVVAFVPAVLGCSHGCAYCVIPSRRGREISRPRADILTEVKTLAAQGIREITLLGQIVDRYGIDLDGEYDLADLLVDTAALPELHRVRFLTSHPNWISDKLLETVAQHPKICPQMEIAVQSGNDEVLERMRRGYTADTYRQLIDRVRNTIPNAAIHTDVIVGFPGETHEQFMDTRNLMKDLEFDKVHIAKYSERPFTYAALKYPDEVPGEDKEYRRKMLEDLQHEIQTRQNAPLAGQTVEVLVESRNKGRWMGRTPRNKIVFFESDTAQPGQLIPVTIDWAGPYSLVGTLKEGVAS
jgi:tRNA-2-methylthio-N6-dimethylallyladenosine synthase